MLQPNSCNKCSYKPRLFLAIHLSKLIISFTALAFCSVVYCEKEDVACFLCTLAAHASAEALVTHCTGAQKFSTQDM